MALLGGGLLDGITPRRGQSDVRMVERLVDPPDCAMVGDVGFFALVDPVFDVASPNRDNPNEHAEAQQGPQ